MRRLLWLGVGLAAGALVVRKLSRAAHSYTPSGIATSLTESAGSLMQSARSFVADVRTAMAEREQEIHRAFAEGVIIDDQFAEPPEEPWVGDRDLFPEDRR